MRPKRLAVWPYALLGALAVGLVWVLSNMGDSEAADSLIYGTPVYLMVGAALGSAVGLTVRGLSRWAAQQRDH
jgi:hypothetical protein